MPHPKVQEAARAILEAFETGTVPAALANVFLYRGASFPCQKWTWRNRLLAAAHGHCDARGFRQWQEAGRHVKAGERAVYILVPCFKKKLDENAPNDEADCFLAGFTAAAVFGYAQTAGEPLAEHVAAEAHLASLPLREVALAWGLDITAFDSHLETMTRPTEGVVLGAYNSLRIGLGVTNLSTWCHELVHAADDRLRTLASAAIAEDEVVAELGGAVLLEMLGDPVASDRGGAWSYIKAQAASTKQNPLALCTKLLDRVCACVDLILRTADELAAGATSIDHPGLFSAPNQLGASHPLAS